MATSRFDGGAPHRLNVMRLTVAGGLTAALMFAFCWVGTLLPYASPTHAYIALFTSAGMTSTAALTEGVLWSFLFGALSGALFALVYNLLVAFERG